MVGSSVGEDYLKDALVSNDECQSSDDACALNALQVSRNQQQVNATEVDAIVTAALSSEAGCHASQSVLRACGAPCFSKHHLSGSCAGCYGRRTDCTLSHCLSPCAKSATSRACTGCVHKRCGGDC